MKNLLLLLFLIPCLVYSQQDGPFKKYNGDVVIQEGQYKNGLMTGEWIFRRDSGNLKGRGKYIDGDGGNKSETSGIPKNGRNGEWTFYHENGNESMVGSFVNGKEEGEFTWYSPIGKKVQVLTYKNGEKEGECTKYYENGKLNRKGTYLNGKRNGKWEYFHDNGKKDFHQYYKNDVKHGEGVLFGENGNVRSEYNYIEGVVEGPYKMYHNNGTLDRKGTYLNGKSNGKWEYFHDNGNKKTVVEFKNGIKEFEGNIQYQYDTYGFLSEEMHYIDGDWIDFLEIRTRESLEKNYGYTKEESTFEKFTCKGRIDERRPTDYELNIRVDIECGNCGSSIRSEWLIFKDKESDCDEREYKCIAMFGCGKMNILKPCSIKHLNENEKF